MAEETRQQETQTRVEVTVKRFSKLRIDELREVGRRLLAEEPDIAAILSRALTNGRKEGPELPG